VGLTLRRGLSGDAGEVLDAQAKLELKRKLVELNESLEDQRERGNHERADEIEEQIEFIHRVVAGAVGIGGRDRRAGSNAERARLNVTRAIKTALEKINEQDSGLASILDRCVRTGTFCSYVPDAESPLTWDFSTNDGTSARELPRDEPNRSYRSRNFLRAFTEGTNFVGRTAERALLRRALDEAQAGAGKIILIGGGAGVGKTRLAAEITAEATKRRMWTFAGGCYDRDEPVPLVPFVEILEAALGQSRDLAAFRQVLGNEASEIARLVPRLRQTFPDIVVPTELPDLPERQSRRVLFDAFTDLVKRVSNISPAVLLLDDLHWADEGTLLLLSHLAQFVPTLPVLILGTYRDSDLDPRGHLGRALDEMLRLHLVDCITLQGLTENTVADMLQALSGQVPPDSIAKLFYSDTGEIRSLLKSCSNTSSSKANSSIQAVGFAATSDQATAMFHKARRWSLDADLRGLAKRPRGR
jgi:hypothetical protein